MIELAAYVVRSWRQRTYNTVRTHLLAQNQQAIDENGHCCYRTTTPEGRVLKCAAGCLIPDDLYEPSMEGVNITAVLLNCESLKERVGVRSVEDMGFLRELQRVHDNTAPSFWPTQLTALAERWGLRP